VSLTDPLLKLRHYTRVELLDLTSAELMDVLAQCAKTEDEVARQRKSR
jgi:hypothetical protein